MRKITKLTRGQIASFVIDPSAEAAVNQRLIKHFEGIQENAAAVPSSTESLRLSIDSASALALQALASASRLGANNHAYTIQRAKHG